MADRSNRRRAIVARRSNNGVPPPAFAAVMTLTTARCLAVSALLACLLPAGAHAKRYHSRTVDTPAPAAAALPLSVGAFRFWKGATVASGDVEDPSLCGV